MSLKFVDGALLQLGLIDSIIIIYLKSSTVKEFKISNYISVLKTKDKFSRIVSKFNRELRKF